MSFLKNWIPEIYLINSNKYPQFENPKGSGVFHDYPHYMVAGKKVPTGHMAAGSFLLVIGLYQLASFALGGSKKVSHGTHKEVAFPAPQRDWEKEKEMFINAYLEQHEGKH